jgi:hypothetical protein
MNRKLMCSVMAAFAVAFAFTESQAQNSIVEWSAFSSEFSVPGSSTSTVKSSVGQALIGRSQQGNSLIESGFLVNRLLRGPLLGVKEQPGLPTTSSLEQNYPNPFNPSTTIRYELPQRSKVELHLFNIIGQHVATLVNEEQDAGRYTLLWSGRNDDGQLLASGVYLYRLTAGEFTDVKKAILMR